MKEKQKFLLAFLLTIFIIRFLIYFIPKIFPQANIIWQDKFHHIFIGIIFLVIYFFIKHRKDSYFILAISLGLVIDQIAAAPFYIADIINKPLAQYSFWYSWSNYNLISTTILIIISIYLIKKYKK